MTFRHTATLLFLAGLLFTGVQGRAQVDAPWLQCLNVAPNGNAIISWEAPADPLNQFVAYHVFRANDPFTLYTDFAQLPAIGTTSHTHNTTVPLTSNMCYYVVSEWSDGFSTFFSPTSDTLCTISLEVQPSVSPVGLAELEWTGPFPSEAPSIGLEYDVLMEYPPGTWNTIATLPYGTNEHSFEVQICASDLNFEIRMDLPTGCTLNSDIDGEFFEDITPPAIPEVTAVTVDPGTGDAVLQWLPSASADTQGYIVYTCAGAVVTAVDTVFGAASTTYIDLLSTPGVAPECYLLAAFDTCYSGIPPSPNTSPTSDVCNCSVHLLPVPYGICENFVNLSWTAYTGWAAGVSTYSIYHSFEGGPFELIGTVSGAETVFTHTFVSIDSGNHSYYVTAQSAVGGYSANSNVRDVIIAYPSAPAYNYLSSASVTGRNEITVTVETAASPTEHLFHLERRRDALDDWDEILVLANLGGTQVVFTDEDVEPSSFSYTYRVLVENLCGQYVDTTNLGTTMVLEGMASTPRLVNILQWTAYDGWENGVAGYRIHRKIGEDGADEVIAELNASQRFYEDDVADLLYSEGQFCYTIEAIEVPSDILPGQSFSANSNELCLVQEPVIWVPNAFVVDGFNSTFRPVISFANFEDYRMIIYSRWGDVIFETTDIEEPWDGRMNGQLVQEGVYAYYISVDDGRGRPYEERGTVLMLSARDQ